MEQLANGRDGGTPAMDDSAMTELSRYPWPGNVRELRNVLERALVMFPQQAVTGTQVRENLLRMKAPERAEEMDALWEASQGLSGIDLAQEAGEPPLPHPAHYADWFSYFDNIDLRRHLARYRGGADRGGAGKIGWHGKPGSRSAEAAPDHADRENEKTDDRATPFRKGRVKVSATSNRPSRRQRSYCGRLARYPFNCRILRPA